MDIDGADGVRNPGEPSLSCCIHKPDHMWETHKTVHLKRLPEQAYVMDPYPLLAQLVEQWTVVPFVTCSNQVERTHSPIAQLVRACDC